jgi:hypothetical protein
MSSPSPSPSRWTSPPLSPSLTEEEGVYISALVAFEGACVSVFADGAGQLGKDDDVESAAGEVGHDDSGPCRFDRCWRGDRRHRRCRQSSLPSSSSSLLSLSSSPATWRQGWGQRGHPPSVVSVVIGSGGSGAVHDPAAAERALLDHCTVPLGPLRDALSLSPSTSSRPRPSHYLPLPLPALVNFQMPPSDAADDRRATTSSSSDVDDVALRRRRHSNIFLVSVPTPPAFHQRLCP